MYGWLGGETYGDYIESAKVSATQGFTALKMGILGAVNIVDTPAVVDANVERFAGIREAVGKDVDVGIDFHGRVSPAMRFDWRGHWSPTARCSLKSPCYLTTST